MSDLAARIERAIAAAEEAGDAESVEKLRGELQRRRTAKPPENVDKQVRDLWKYMTPEERALWTVH